MAAPLLGACGNIQTTNTKKENTEMKNEKTTTDTGKRDTIYFAGGCFWGTQHFLKQIDGVVSTEAG
ncbi:MAG: peptide-methionine (S)-S-oxide reductase, partial [Duncaniella sp.]|nr:peptide-methionine (S)-S-oxide reductase [Duncaniella sp.]